MTQTVPAKIRFLGGSFGVILSRLKRQGNSLSHPFYSCLLAVPLIKRRIMVTSEKLFGKIKAMSSGTLSPYPRILLKDIPAEFPIPQDALLVLLIELENRCLIKIYHTGIASVSLTGYGATHDNPPGGVNSEGN